MAPLFYLRPGVLVVVESTGDDVEGDGGTLEGVGDLGHAAGRAVREPLSGVRMRVVEGGTWLEVQDDHRDPGLTDRGQDLRARRVGGGVAEDEIHPLFGEPFARSVRFRGRIDEAWRDDRRPP